MYKNRLFFTALGFFSITIASENSMPTLLNATTVQEIDTVATVLAPEVAPDINTAITATQTVINDVATTDADTEVAIIAIEQVEQDLAPEIAALEAFIPKKEFSESTKA